MPRLALAVLLAASALPAAAQSPAARSPAAGDWSGELVGAGLTIVFHVTEADGALAATFDVPLQGAAGIPTGATTLAGDSLTVTVPAIGGRFAGALRGDTVAGTWTQGGLVAPMAANALDAVAFVVLLAGPAVPGRDVLRFQLARGLDASPAGLALYDAGLGAMQDALASGDAATAPARASAALNAAMAGLPARDSAAVGAAALDVERSLISLAEPWMRFFIAYNPVPALRALRVPALAVFGQTDQQVRALDNVPAMRAALAAAPAGSDVLVLPGLNHLFQPSATGDGAEYGRIETSFSPVMMAAVADWVLARR